LIHRRDHLRSEKILQDRLFKNNKIKTLWFHEVEEILGDENPLGVTGIKVKHTKTNEISHIDCKGVFVAIGHAPENALVKDQLETHMGGYVITKPNSTSTSIPGIFVAGDLTDYIYRQAVTSAGMGCMAALEAEKFLAEEE
jgi:thioredoxin reductase (NADPH)